MSREKFAAANEEDSVTLDREGHGEKIEEVMSLIEAQLQTHISDGFLLRHTVQPSAHSNGGIREHIQVTVEAGMTVSSPFEVGTLQPHPEPEYGYYFLPRDVSVDDISNFVSDLLRRLRL